MGSKSVLTVPGAVYQVFAHGIPENGIFRNDNLKAYFLKKLSELLKNYSYRCLGWSVLDDHFHLIVKTSILPISSFMNKLNTSFALRYNHVHKREGHVFSSRFNGIIVQEELFIKDLVRWVHLNPVRRGACSLNSLKSYRWSGHREIVKDEQGIIDCDALLRNFSGVKPVNSYRKFVLSAPQNYRDVFLIRCVREANQGWYSFTKAESWVVGDPKFTTMVFSCDITGSRNVARYIKENVSLEKLKNNIVSLMKVKNSDFFKPKRSNVSKLAQEVLAFVALYRFGFKRKDIATYLGVSNATVSKLIKQGHAFCEGSAAIHTLFKEIEEMALMKNEM
ncbi:transposase [Chitinispirillales bacterium ANBcel5]|uniref:transposase n=1 Tax=Cellulosispirillum alkaliphilum TaxID=3039283 RepID=UPI002A5325A7|nr:transposase [Chitinispirillales bacterium ANBcel5]